VVVVEVSWRCWWRGGRDGGESGGGGSVCVRIRREDNGG